MNKALQCYSLALLCAYNSLRLHLLGSDDEDLAFHLMVTVVPDLSNDDRRLLLDIYGEEGMQHAC